MQEGGGDPAASPSLRPLQPAVGLILTGKTAIVVFFSSLSPFFSFCIAGMKVS